MKKRTIHVDQFVGYEFSQFLKHFKHGRYPGERRIDKAIRHAQRQSEKIVLRSKE